MKSRLVTIGAKIFSGLQEKNQEGLMNRVLCSWVTKLIALLGGYIAAFSVVRSFSSSFRYYIGRGLGDWIIINTPMISILLFIAFSVLLIVSVWKSKKKITPAWRNIDLTLLVVLVFCAVLLCVYFARYSSSWFTPISSQLLSLSIIAYITVMALLMELTARVRERCFALYWPRFFGLYPIWQPAGLLMAMLLTVNIIYLIYVCPSTVVRGDLNIVLLLFSAFTLIALTYFCSFILSLSTEYERANAEKVRAERFKAELITNVSHDIRTPLTTIINYVDLVKALPVEHADFKAYMGILDKKAARLKTLIDDLMEASKASTGNISVDFREIDLSEIVGQIAGEFEDQFTERKLALVLRQPDCSVYAKADSRHLWRVLENLFGNTVKYALPGTRVFAEIFLRNGRTVFSLKNTSQNPIDLSGDMLTEQFIRGDRARLSEGSGLGLYIAKSLAELMGGQLVIRASGDLFEVEIAF